MKSLALAAAIAAFASPAIALPIVSGDGNETCNGGSCYVVPAHPAWATVPAPAEWIAPQPAEVFVPNYPSWTVAETFTVAADVRLLFTVWADDVAELAFNGQLIPLVPSYRPGDEVTFEVLALAGENTFAAEVRNTGLRFTFEDNPTAIAYTAAPVSLPATALLLAGGLVGLACLRRARA